MAHITKPRHEFYRKVLTYKKQLVEESLKQFRGWGRIQHTADHLGITPQTIHNILKEAKREGI